MQTYTFSNFHAGNVVDNHRICALEFDVNQQDQFIQLVRDALQIVFLHLFLFSVSVTFFLTFVMFMFMCLKCHYISLLHLSSWIFFSSSEILNFQVEYESVYTYKMNE